MSRSSWGRILCALGLSITSLLAQTAPLAPRPNLTSAQSGLEYFRRLLAASSEERQKLLAEKRPEHRQILLRNLRAYDALTPEEREYRLRSMELRFHLATLMRLAPSNRPVRLQQVPLPDQALVEERLRIWDQLSPEDQKDLLEKEMLARVVGVLVPSPVRSVTRSGSASSNELQQIELSFGRLKSLSEAKRALIQANFERLFELRDPATARQELESLGLPAAERELMNKTLEKFRTLTKPQRDACIQNFKKLAQLPPEEMRQFLKNAEEWQKMSPQDREQWRRLVNKLSPLPPLPPGFNLPPTPPKAFSRPQGPALVYSNQ